MRKTLRHFLQALGGYEPYTINLLYHWLAPPSFIDQLKQQVKGAIQSNPAQVELLLPDLEHFGLVCNGEINAEAICQLVSLVGDFRDRLPVYVTLHELISRGYDLGEAVGFVYAQPDFFFDSKRSRLDTEGFRFYEAIKPPHWDQSRPFREEIKTYVGLRYMHMPRKRKRDQDGLGLYTRPDSSYWWVSFIKRDGQTARRSTGVPVEEPDSRARAQAIRVQWVVEALDGRLSQPSDRHTFDELMLLYLKSVSPHNKE